MLGICGNKLLETEKVLEMFECVDKLYPPCKIWREVTNTKEIETIILQRNKRHLQQASIEDGQVHNPMIQKMVENYGCNDLIDDLRSRKVTLDKAVDEAIQA